MESGFQKRLAETPETQKVNLTSPKAVDAEVQKRVKECRDSATIEIEIQRRVAEKLPEVEKEIERRVNAIRSAPTADHSAGMETSDPAEPTSREAPPAYTPPDIDAMVSRRVSDKVKAIKENLDKEFEQNKQEVDGRIAKARDNFKNYMNKNLAEQAAKLNAEAKSREEEQIKTIEVLQQEISRLKTEIDELKKALTEFETRAAKAEAVVDATGRSADFQRALSAKDEECKEALEKLRHEQDTIRSDMRLELHNELKAEHLAANQAPSTDNKGQPKPPQTKEAILRIVAVNVDHRLRKEREMWEKAWVANYEEEIQQRVAEQVQKVLSNKVSDKEGGLETKLKELEQKLAESEQKIKSSEEEMEKQKDALRQEGAARIKVQLSMLDKKNKSLEEQVKNLKGQSPNATPIVQRRQSQIAGVTTSAPQPKPQQQIPQTPANGIPSQITSIAATEPNVPRRGESHGTGPAALRSLRGTMGTGLPRAGGGSGRGSGRAATIPNVSGSQPASAPPSPQQLPVVGANPFANQLPPSIPQSGIPQPGILQSGIPQNPFAAIHRPGQIVSGRGGFASRGRGLPGVQTSIPRAGVSQGQMSPSSQAKANMNPSARQFVPGKRVRDEAAGDSEEGMGRGDGKRVRGQ